MSLFLKNCVKFLTDRGTFIVGDEQSIQNLYQDNGEVARIFGRMAHKIVTHKNFNSEHFQKYAYFFEKLSTARGNSLVNNLWKSLLEI